jgi:hypothetical protein
MDKSIIENPTIVVDHDAGFFSCCTIRLMRIVQFYSKNKILPIVDSSNQWSFYKDSPGDITNLFFKDIPDTKELDFEIGYYKDGVDNELSPYSILDFKNLNFLIKKYFSPSEQVLNIYESLLEKYKIDYDKTIAVCYRGNDKHKETNLPSHLEMISKIDELVQENPDYKIFIQSDEVDFYESVLKKYPDSIYINEIMKVRKNDSSPIQYLIPIGSRSNQAIIFLAILNIISNCSKIILNSGNVGMWISLYRGNSNDIHQYLNHKEYIYGVYNKRYLNQNEFWIKN